MKPHENMMENKRTARNRSKSRYFTRKNLNLFHCNTEYRVRMDFDGMFGVFQMVLGCLRDGFTWMWMC